jgi:hypothetical protein
MNSTMTDLRFLFVGSSLLQRRHNSTNRVTALGVCSIASMDIGQDVTEFVGYGSRLFRRLRREGGELTAVDLHMLMVQLHILDSEAANLQILRKMQDSEAA